MVDVKLADSIDIAQIETMVERVRGITYEDEPLTHRPGLECVVDRDYHAKTLTIDFQQLIRALIEHAQFEAADPTPTRLAILRAVEQAADGTEAGVVTIEQIQTSLDSDVATSTLYEHLRVLIDDELVERIGERSGVYRYSGP